MRRRSRELKSAMRVSFSFFFIVLICLCHTSPGNYLCTFFATNSSYHNSHAEGITVILTFSHLILTLPILFEVFQWKSWGYLLISYQIIINWMSGWFFSFWRCIFDRFQIGWPMTSLPLWRPKWIVSGVVSGMGRHKSGMLSLPPC